jgi:hypothetical protein
VFCFVLFATQRPWETRLKAPLRLTSQLLVVQQQLLYGHEDEQANKEASQQQPIVYQSKVPELYLNEI